ncbi:MAG: tyrosine-type recombinase/integrase [Pseudomonadota bacterium]
MPLTIYKRRGVYWVRGRIDYRGRPITDYYRESTGAPSEEGAEAWVELETERRIRAHLLGDAAAATFADAVALYDAPGAEAAYLLKVIDHLGDRPLASISPAEIRALAKRLYPKASTDTWTRQVVSPIRAVINAAHDRGLCPPIKVRAYTAAERVAQDKARGKMSRQRRTPASRDWIERFMGAADPHNAAMAAFMFETGARIGQVVEIRPEHLRLETREVYLPSSKAAGAQWVAISAALAKRLARLRPVAPIDTKRKRRLEPRVFGYADRGGMRWRWRRICEAAGIEYLSPHAAGRHGFYTETRVRGGIDAVNAAAAGRWSGPALPDRVYAHATEDERRIREMIGGGLKERPAPEAAKQMKAKRVRGA